MKPRLARWTEHDHRDGENEEDGAEYGWARQAKSEQPEKGVRLQDVRNGRESRERWSCSESDHRPIPFAFRIVITRADEAASAASKGAS